MDAPLELCEQRDTKGLYKKARAGEIGNFTGISSPYEAPIAPDFHLDTKDTDPHDLVEQIVNSLFERDLLKPD